MKKKCLRTERLARIAAGTIVVLLLTVLASAFSVSAAENSQEAGDIMYFWPLDYNADDVISGKSFYFETFDDYTDGAYPGSVAFDSTVSGAGYTDPVTADVNAFTVAAWINIPSENSTEWNCIFSSGELSRSDFIELYYHKGTAGTEIRGSVGNKLDMYFNSEFDDYDSWHHVALTYSAETGMLTGYLDGAKVVDKNVSDTNFDGFNDTVLYLGFELKNYVFGNTLIDDLLFVYRDLSPEEINALYSDPAAFSKQYAPEVTPTPVPTEVPTPVPTEAPQATQASATEKGEAYTAAPTDPPATQNSGKNNNGQNNKSNTGIIIAAIAAVLAVAVVIIILAIKKKKK